MDTSAKKRIKNLEYIIKSIENLLNEPGFNDTVEFYDLRKKFIGPLGEGYAAIKIESVGWSGGQGKNMDMVGKDGKRYQVKSSYEGNKFQIMSIKVDSETSKCIRNEYNKKRKVIKTDKKKKQMIMFKAKDFVMPECARSYFKKAFHEKFSNEVDYFLLVWLDKRSYFRIPENKMADLACAAYEDYFRKSKHRSNFNCGISNNTGIIQIVLDLRTGTNTSVFKRVKKYELS